MVEIEPVYYTSVRNRKPDLVAVKDYTALVIYAQVSGDGIALDSAHDATATYYRKEPGLHHEYQAKTHSSHHRGIHLNHVVRLNAFRSSDEDNIHLRQRLAYI